MGIEDVATKRQLQEFIQNTQKPGLPTDVKHLKSIANDALGKSAAAQAAAEAAQGTEGSSLPLAPDHGDIFYFAVGSNGEKWTLRYNQGTLSPYKWEFVGGSPLRSEVDTLEATTSTTYAALATAGPQITLPFAGDYIIRHGADITHNTATALRGGAMSYDVGGTGANDADYANLFSTGTGAGDRASVARTRRKNGLAASTSIVAKYRALGGADSAQFAYRWLEIQPVRVG